jgi:hypothetical protein
MNKEILNQPINTKGIIIGMVLLFITLQIGFHPTYFKYSPEFKKFTWLHHIHGMLMASWIILLVVQPILIHKGKLAAHRFIGKLSYIVAPLMIASMFLILRFSYHKGILKRPSDAVISFQSLTIMQLICFTLFFILAIISKKNTFKHMRYMIGTALVFVTPPLSRVLGEYFKIEIIYAMYFSAGLAAIFLVYDIYKKKNWLPNTIILLMLVLSIVLFQNRKSEVWLVFGRFVASTFY